jgi:hypothetical protein
MHEVDSLLTSCKEIDGKWVVARPYVDMYWKVRLLAAWKVLTGKADAVTFYKQ